MNSFFRIPAAGRCHLESDVSSERDKEASTLHWALSPAVQAAAGGGSQAARRDLLLKPGEASPVGASVTPGICGEHRRARVRLGGGPQRRWRRLGWSVLATGEWVALGFTALLFGPFPSPFPLSRAPLWNHSPGGCGFSHQPDFCVAPLPGHPYHGFLFPGLHSWCQG